MEASPTPPILTLTSPDGLDIPLPTIPVQKNVSNQKETTCAPREKSTQRAVPHRNDVPLVAHAVEGRGCQTAERMGVYIDESGNV